MTRLKLLASLIALTGFLVGTNSAFAAPSPKPSGGASSTPLGIDISWPQCGKKLPGDPAFVIVGVNGGLATTPNPCLKEQLSYAASKATGLTPQEKIQLYVNTANPGGLNTASWPKNNVDSSGNTSPNPYLECKGADDLACAWQYGWNRAVDDVEVHFKPAASTARVTTDPTKYIWWLDVETENSWKLGSSSFDYQSNTAVLEGMATYLKSKNLRVGLYSTALQWDAIVGNAVSSTSNLNGLPNWRPGGASLATAKDACTARPLTPGGNVSLTQFVMKNLDYNYSC